MIIQIDRTGTVPNFETTLNQVSSQDNIAGILILSCDQNRFTAAEIDPILAQISVPVIGGIFPEIMHGREKLTQGTIIAGLPIRPDICIIDGLSDMTADYEEAMDNALSDINQAQTMLVFVDGLSTRISDLIDSLFHIFGLDINYIGGGAGSLSFEQRPCLFTNSGLRQDCAVLGLIDTRSGIGVSHGWQTIRGPFKVTEVERNVIKTLDWRPAFDVYREVVEAVSGQTFTDDNFFDIAKGYPFGINKFDSEKIVRDPIVLGENGAMVCVGEVPEESYLSILRGSVPSLVQAAATALDRSKDDFNHVSPVQTTLFIDCISRVLFLNEDFDQELKAVYDEQVDLIGALTLGEIANNGRDYLEFYNKTAVVAILDM